MAHGQPLELRVFVDASAVEVFTGCGQALSTRVYRGAPPAGAPAAAEGPRLRLLSLGGPCTLATAEVHRVGSGWLRGEADAPLAPPLSREVLEQWQRAAAAAGPSAAPEASAAAMAGEQ